MSTTVTNNFDDKRIKAFDLKYIEIIRTKQELDALPSPKVIFTTSPTMDYGYAHDIIGETKFNSNPNNTIIFTNKPSSNPSSLSYKLAKNIIQGKTIIQGIQSSVKIDHFTKYIREKISGQQLIDWENAKKKIEDERIAMQLKKEAEAQLLEFSAEEVVKDDQNQDKDAFQIDLKQFGQYAKPVHPMFNFKVKRVEFDAYGEVLDQNTLDRYTQKFTTVGANEMDVDGGDTNNTTTTTTTNNNNNKTTADGSDKNNNNNSNNSKNNKDNNEMDEDDSDEDKEDEDEDLEDAIPTIMRKEIIKGGITIKCQIKYAPLLGLANHRSCGILIRQVNPKKLILVGTGTEEEEEEDMAKSSSSSNKKKQNELSNIASTILSSSGFEVKDDLNTNVFIPSSDKRDIIKIDADSKYFETVVDDELLRKMQISTLGAYEIGILDAIYSDVENNKIMKQNAAVGKNAITTTTTSSNELAHVALNMEQLTLSKAPEKVTIGKGGVGIEELINKPTTIVGVGDLRLLDMRNDLNEKLGVQTEIREGGVLMTEMGISITKHGPNDFSIEGPLCELYYKVRNIMYQHFTFV